MKGASKMSEIQNDELEDKKLNQMKVEILTMEKKNLKTREKSFDDMVEAVRKTIVYGVKKTY